MASAVGARRRRSRRPCRRCAPRSPSREHRLAVLTGERAGAADGRPGAARLSRRSAKAIALGAARSSCSTAGPTCAPPSAGWRRRAAREGVAAADLYPRITRHGRARPARRTRQPVRHGRLARLGGDAGAAVERVRPRQRAGAAARRAGGDRAKRWPSYEQTMLLALEETENALVAYREQQERLVKLTDQARESARAAGIARVRYREGVADFLVAARRRAHAAAGRGRRGPGRGRRLHRAGRALPGGRRPEVARCSIRDTAAGGIDVLVEGNPYGSK